MGGYPSVLVGSVSVCHFKINEQTYSRPRLRESTYHRTGVGRFHSSMHKWGLAPSPNCECGASEQTADHVLTACPIDWAPHGVRGLTVLNDKTRCWLNNTTASIWSGQCRRPILWDKPTIFISRPKIYISYQQCDLYQPIAHFNNIFKKSLVSIAWNFAKHKAHSLREFK